MEKMRNSRLNMHEQKLGKIGLKMGNLSLKMLQKRNVRFLEHQMVFVG